MDISLTGTKKEIDDFIALVRGCPAYTHIRVSSYERLSYEVYSCRIEYVFDSSVPSGKDSPDVFHKYQRALLGEKGGYAGGKPPYGYKAEKGVYLIVPEEAKAVRRIFDLRNEKMTLTAIAEELEEEGYPTRSGKPWRYTAVQSILASRNTYLGYYHYGKGTPWINGSHQAILDGKAYHPDFSKDGYKEEDDSSQIEHLR